MTFPTPRCHALIAAAAVAVCCTQAHAQLQPTVVYSPVVAPQPLLQPPLQQPLQQPFEQVVYRPVQQPVAVQPVAAQAVAVQPVVLQQSPPVNNRWYPGKYIGRLFRRPRNPAPATLAAVPVAAAPIAAAPVAQPTFVTAAYRPTFPPSYTTFSVAPSVQTVARPVMLAPTVVSRPVTLSAMSPCDSCSTCASIGDTCSACSDGVTTAGFETPIAPGCSSCAAQPAPYAGAPAQDYGTQGYGSPSYGDQGFGAGTPTPALPPNANVPETRVNREPLQPIPDYSPADSGTFDPGPTVPAPAPATGGAEGDGSTSWWGPAPQLFDARGDRSAARPMNRQPTANVWNAVYQQPARPRSATVQQTAYRTQVTAQQRPARHQQVGASGWRSAP